MTDQRICIICKRPLPPLTWTQRLPLIGWLLEPPPFHDPSRDTECHRLFRDQAGLPSDEDV